MKRIKITEINYKDILNKIQNTTNKYKCFEFYRVLNENFKKCKESDFAKRSSIGFRKRMIKVRKHGKTKYRHFYKFESNNIFLDVAEHAFKTEFDSDEHQKEFTDYITCGRPLIHVDDGPLSAVVLRDNADYIRFLPFGIIVLYTNNDDIFDNKKYYRHIYIPDIFNGRITDINFEKEKRFKEWNNEMEDQYWNELEEKMIGLVFDEDDL